MQFSKWRHAAPVLVLLLFSTGRVSEAAASIPGAPGVRVLLPEDVLASHTRSDGSGNLLFREADGTWIRLITKIEDPEIVNRGDGRFHPAQLADVIGSLEAIPPAYLAGLNLEIYILPFPRTGRVASSAGEGAIYVSPGVREYETRHVHFLLAHEVGHAVHRKYLPDEDQDGWNAYRWLRGISRTELFHADAPHAYRPHEIFAEDFRVLFGGPLARADGSVENPELTLPGALPRLPDFFRRLVGAAGLASETMRLVPNPYRGESELTLVGPSLEDGFARESHATLLDLSGRRLVTVPTRAGANGTLTFDFGPNRGLAAGAYWIRIEDGRRSEVVPLRIVR